MVIYLTGFMGAGKTTAGKKLAAQLNFTFVDMDDLLTRETNTTISDLFEKGEKHFREIESEVLKKTAAYKNTVFATGGGTPCYHDGMDWMNEHGTTIYLKLTVGTLFHRLMASKNKRPLISGKGDVELMEFIMEKLEEREPCYRSAKHILKGESLDINKLAETIRQQQAQLK